MPTPIDSTEHIETPEGIELTLRTAGPVPRALAWGIDALIRYSVIAVLSMILVMLGGLGMGIILILAFISEWFYPVLFEVLRQGMTPGKKSMGLRVVHDDGTPISWSRSILRNLLLAADFMPAAFGSGLMSMLLQRQFKRLGDLAAGTLVVYVEPQHAGSQIPAGRATAPLRSLSAAEQRLIVSWAERQSLLSQPRTVELADLLTPLTRRNGLSGVNELTEYARWSAGMHSQRAAPNTVSK